MRSPAWPLALRENGLNIDLQLVIPAIVTAEVLASLKRRSKWQSATPCRRTDSGQSNQRRTTGARKNAAEPGDGSHPGRHSPNESTPESRGHDPSFEKDPSTTALLGRHDGVVHMCGPRRVQRARGHLSAGGPSRHDESHPHGRSGAAYPNRRFGCGVGGGGVPYRLPAGDTITMCALSTGEALSRLQGAGWCNARQGWSTVATLHRSCVIPDGRHVWVYKVTPLVLGQLGMEFAATDTGDGVWRVTLFGHVAARSLCTN